MRDECRKLTAYRTPRAIPRPPELTTETRRHKGHDICSQSDRAMTDARTSEEQFYRRYSWCLNPALSVEDLLQRYREEMDRYPALTGWQREESKTNLYLCAFEVAC